MDNNKQTAEFSARQYLFDLSNIAAENGFKQDERWEVNMSTAAEKQAIEKQYYPTVASDIMPDLISATFRLVKEFLRQPVTEQGLAREHMYLVAYNPIRLRR
ncbi:MAG: hypothetical protein V4577_17225 [Bacteroidota bacterium]